MPLKTTYILSFKEPVPCSIEKFKLFANKTDDMEYEILPITGTAIIKTNNINAKKIRKEKFCDFIEKESIFTQL